MENICHWPRLPSERPSSTSHRFRFCLFLPSAAFDSASPPATMAAGTRVLVWNESLLSAHHPANGTSGPLGCSGLILLPVVSRRSRSGSQRIHFVGDHRAPVCSCDLFDRPELGSDSGSGYGNIGREMTYAAQMEDCVTIPRLTCFPRFPITLWERPIGI